VDLLQKLQPDGVLGVFRFTGPLSAALADVPYDSLICGSMTPAFTGALGLAADEPGAREQAEAMAGFRSTCARRMRPALAALGLAPVDDAWDLLVGRRTFLWDYPEFEPLPITLGYHHVGPVQWTHWPRPEVDAGRLDKLRGPIAYVSFGTGGVPTGWLRHIVDTLWLLGYSVALALGGQATATDFPTAPERLAVFEFLPVELVFARASLVVCHGGQGLIFEALRQRLPVFVLPMQPEQAQNGLCVERIGCGRRLLRGVVFTGQSTDFETPFLACPVRHVADEIAEFLSNEQTPSQLALASSQISRYRGTDTLATLLSNP
jgi:UDP:flavonoid glycosyltransferase YjiC (YdhE family)